MLLKNEKAERDKKWGSARRAYYTYVQTYYLALEHIYNLLESNSFSWCHFIEVRNGRSMNDQLWLQQLTLSWERLKERVRLQEILKLENESPYILYPLRFQVSSVRCMIIFIIVTVTNTAYIDVIVVNFIRRCYYHYSQINVVSVL